MLVLSRRIGEKIVIPNLGVTIEVVRVQGNSAKIGIEAPPSVRVLRQELQEQADAQKSPVALFSPHDRNNRLNRITLGIHLYRRQRDAGMHEEAALTFKNLLADLEGLKKHAGIDRASGPAPQNHHARCRTLVVDDDVNERELLAGLLSMNGCDCATAADGQEALEYLHDHDRPDVVLLDMRMPRCDGPSTLRAIRQEARFAGLRVFCVSGTPPQEAGITSGPNGFDGWFPKPLDPHSLWETIQKSISAPAASN